MSKLIDEPITLSKQARHSTQDGVPTLFRWRGRDYRVEAIGGQWRVLGRWWQGEGERRYVRAMISRGPAMDLCHDMKTGGWVLHELQD